jgi:hypothetical protein
MAYIRYKESLCMSCCHAYGDDCFSYPFDERTWIEELHIIEKKGGAYDTRKILKCSRYKPGRRPLSRGRPTYLEFFKLIR